MFLRVIGGEICVTPLVGAISIEDAPLVGKRAKVRSWRMPDFPEWPLGAITLSGSGVRRVCAPSCSVDSGTSRPGPRALV